MDNFHAANNNDRLSDTAAIVLGTGYFDYEGSGSSNSSETVGAISVPGGLGSISVNDASTATMATLNAASLTRPANGGVISFDGTNLGLNGTSTSNVSRLFFATAPTLVGAGPLTSAITKTEHNAPIIPFAVGSSDLNSGSGGTYQSQIDTFVTYAPATGIRPLNPADEFSNTISAGDNVNVVSATTATASTSVNSLRVASGLTLNSGVKLTVTSGTVMLYAVDNVTAADTTASLGFNNGEAIVFAIGNAPDSVSRTATLATNLSDLTSLSFNGGGGGNGLIVVLSQSSNTTDTAPTYLRGCQLSVSNDYNLGYATGSNAITFAANADSELQFTGNAFATTKGILLAGNAVFLTQFATNAGTLGGVVSGPGIFTTSGPGTITLTNSANTYTGPTVIHAGTLALVANSNNNIASTPRVTVGDVATATPSVLDATGLTAAGGFRLQNGQSLFGVGTVKPPSGGLVVDTGSIISPGDGVSTTGNLTTAGKQVWNSGGSYQWKIDLSNVGASSTFNNDKTGLHWDQLTMNSLSVAATNGAPFSIQIVGLPGTGSTPFDPTKTYQWVAANAPAGSVTGNLSNTLALSISGFTAYQIPGFFSAGFDSADDTGLTDLVITYSPTPEPTSFVLMSLATAAGVLRRRRRIH